MKELIKTISDFLQKNKDPHLRFPKNIDSILDERNSSWSFNIELNNTTSGSKEIALLTGAVNSDRFVTIDATKSYKSINGEDILTPYPEGTIINVKDDPRLIKKIVGGTIHAVASQEHHNGSSEQAIIKQVIYKDLTGQVTITSKDYFLNFLKEFIKTASVRSWEMHVSTTNPELFNGKITMQETNPFSKEYQEYIELEQYFSDSNIEAQKVIIDRPINLTEETFLSVTVPANTSVSYGFRVSAYLSNGNAIKNKLKTSNFIKSVLKATEEKPKAKKTDATSLTASK